VVGISGGVFCDWRPEMNKIFSQSRDSASQIQPNVILRRYSHAKEVLATRPPKTKYIKILPFLQSTLFLLFVLSNLVQIAAIAD